MPQGYAITMVRKYKHLDIKKRAQLELLLRSSGISVRLDIAIQLPYHERHIKKKVLTFFTI